MTNNDISKLNEFLDKEVVDKKLKDRLGYAGYDPDAKKTEEEWVDPNQEKEDDDEENE